MGSRCAGCSEVGGHCSRCGMEGKDNIVNSAKSCTLSHLKQDHLISADSQI